jgi:hypothetical protein
MTLHLSQASPFLEVSQPAIAQFQSFIIGNSNQVNKCVSFLAKDFSGEQNPIVHRFRNPEMHHFGNLRMLSLSHLFGISVALLIRLLPLLPPFGFGFDPERNQRLFDLKVRVYQCKMSHCSRLIFAILVVPIENFDSLN